MAEKRVSSWQLAVGRRQLAVGRKESFQLAVCKKKTQKQAISHSH
jgi:hypothetical protein